jgi:5-methylcytosine-specific restriction protein A
MNQSAPTPCGLCGRGFPIDSLTKHHCLPKSKGGTSEDVSMICSQCHGMVHATFTNATLAAVYTTIEELRQAPELAAFIKWVRKRPITRKKRNKERRRKV